ncbi:MAG: metallophosphoesterase [Clostridia bacterium]|nr:metallophosphoesterase [Clostridia bacterium]
MKKTSLWIKAISVVLALSLVLAAIPMMASADDTSVRFGLLSDVHYYPNSLKGDSGDAYQEFTTLKGKEYNENNALLANALDGFKRQADEDGLDFVLLPGDLTKDGELEGHKELAAKLEAFEEETGIPVYVIPGNHDVNNSDACTFENGVKEPAAKTGPAQFREVYQNLGYGEALATFTPKPGNQGGMLSYTADLGEHYRLIAVDSNEYSVDNGAKSEEHMTDGRVGDDLLAWIVEQADLATAEGKTIIFMQHHNLIPHMDIEEATFWAFVTEDWQRVADAYADHGIHYVFTGHLHASDTSSYINDNGEEITDILTPTLTGYPNFFRIVDFSTDRGEVTMDLHNYDIDEYQPVVSDSGFVYEKPYRLSASFGQTFGESAEDPNIEGYIMNILTALIGGLFGDIQEAGGLIKYLSFKGVDLESIIQNALGTDGVAIGDFSILTVSKNVMGFLNDLGDQIDEVYISHPEETLAKLQALIHELLEFKVSTYPATYVTDMLGAQVEADGCTLGEFATAALLAYYGGDEDLIDNYPFIKDTLDGFDSGKSAEAFFTLLRKVLVNELVEDELLTNLDLNLDALFPFGNAFFILGKVLQGVLNVFLGGDNSFSNVIDSILSLSVIPEGYGSIDEIIDTLVVNEYMTPSQYEAWGHTIAWMVGSLVTDDNPYERFDNNITVTYAGPVDVPATRENYRLPANLNLTLGDDSATAVTITWLTKYSLTNSDIELVPYSEAPRFTGEPTTDSRVRAQSEEVERGYPGADLGIFGLLDYMTEYCRHTVTLTGLEPGTKYCYRVGDAARGWWSEPGVIETAGGSDAFTFLTVTDAQSQRADHYADHYAAVIDAAQTLYPDAKFIVSAGDQVDLGKNMKQWQLFFNSTDAFASLPFMPTTGNHEKATAAITSQFTLPNVPEQDLETGVYYSYDYNGVHFTVLNTNDDDDKKLSDAQVNWLIDDIRNAKSDWKVLVLHKALYSNGSHYDDKEVAGFRNQLSALLPYLGVDLVVQGHDHVYLRTDAMNANAVVPSKTGQITYGGETYDAKYDPKGTVYSICGTSGVKVYQTKDTAATDKLFPRAEKIIDSDKSMFAAVTVDGDTLYYNAYQVADGKAERVDNFAIVKSDPGSSPADSAGALGTLFAKILSKLNIKYTWKLLNAVIGIFSKVAQLLRLPL